MIQVLSELAGGDVALKDWLQQPNPAFGERAPMAVIGEGESDLIWEMVYQIRQGAFA